MCVVRYGGTCPYRCDDAACHARLRAPHAWEAGVIARQSDSSSSRHQVQGPGGGCACCERTRSGVPGRQIGGCRDRDVLPGARTKACIYGVSGARCRRCESSSPWASACSSCCHCDGRGTHVWQKLVGSLWLVIKSLNLLYPARLLHTGIVLACPAMRIWSSVCTPFRTPPQRMQSPCHVPSRATAAHAVPLPCSITSSACSPSTSVRSIRADPLPQHDVSSLDCELRYAFTMNAPKPSHAAVRRPLEVTSMPYRRPHIARSPLPASEHPRCAPPLLHSCFPASPPAPGPPHPHARHLLFLALLPCGHAACRPACCPASACAG